MSSSNAAQTNLSTNSDVLLVARVVLFISHELPLYSPQFLAAFQNYVNTIFTLFMICVREHPLNNLPPLPPALGLCTLKQIRDLVHLSSQFSSPEILQLADLERGRLRDKYPCLAGHIHVMYLQGVEWYQNHWKSGPRGWEIFAYQTENHVTFLGPFPFSLHAASTSLIVRIGAATPQGDDLILLIPLDSNHPCGGFFTPAEFDVLSQNFALDINKPFGYYEVKPDHIANIRSRTRIRCMHCGFMASVAWRNQVGGKHSWCQNGNCKKKRYVGESKKKGKKGEEKGKGVDGEEAEGYENIEKGGE